MRGENSLRSALFLPPLPPGGDADNDVVDARAGGDSSSGAVPVAAIGAELAPRCSSGGGGTATRGARAAAKTTAPAGLALRRHRHADHRRLGGRRTRRSRSRAGAGAGGAAWIAGNFGCGARPGAGAVLEVAGTDAGHCAPGGFGSGTAGSGTTGRGSRDPPGGTGSGGAPSMVNGIEEAEAMLINSRSANRSTLPAGTPRVAFGADLGVSSCLSRWSLAWKGIDAGVGPG